MHKFIYIPLLKNDTQLKEKSDKQPKKKKSNHQIMSLLNKTKKLHIYLAEKWCMCKWMKEKKEVKKTNWTKNKNKKRLLTWTKPLCTYT